MACSAGAICFDSMPTSFHDINCKIVGGKCKNDEIVAAIATSSGNEKMYVAYAKHNIRRNKRYFFFVFV